MRWALRKEPGSPKHTRPVYALMASLPIGTLVLDEQVSDRVDWEMVDGYDALSRWGFGRPGGMRVRECGRGPNREHAYVALLHEAGTPLSVEAHRQVQLLAEPLAAAVARMRVPLVAGSPILWQVVREQGIGLAVISPSGHLLESNHQAHRIAVDWREAARLCTRRRALRELISAALGSRAPASCPWCLTHPEKNACLEVSFHAVNADVHSISEPARLVLLRERSLLSPAQAILEKHRLSPRLIQVARLLCESSCRTEGIARQLGITKRTVDKHVERLYRELGVRSRHELRAALLGHMGSSEAKR